MLTRIRLSAEGPTVTQVEHDLFAAYDLLTAALYATGTGVVPPTRLTGEHYEQSDGTPDPTVPRWYRGRAIVEFPVDAGREMDADRLRWRGEAVKRWDEASFRGSSGGGGVFTMSVAATSGTRSDEPPDVQESSVPNATPPSAPRGSASVPLPGGDG